MNMGAFWVSGFAAIWLVDLVGREESTGTGWTFIRRFHFCLPLFDGSNARNFVLHLLGLSSELASVNFIATIFCVLCLD